MKCGGRKKLFHSSALFSLFWSLFYAGRIIVFIFTTYRFGGEIDILNNAQWEVIQCLLSLMGILISFSLFNAYKKDGSTLIIYSWIFWMFANFMVSLLLLHKSIFELISRTPFTSVVSVINDLLDIAHIFNAPGTIYFILVFITYYYGNMTSSSKDILFGTMKTQHGYKRLDKFEVLHLHHDITEEEVVHYV